MIIHNISAGARGQGAIAPGARGRGAKRGWQKIVVVVTSQRGDIGVARGVGVHCDSMNTYSF
jgi:hypothetical protein